MIIKEIKTLRKGFKMFDLSINDEIVNQDFDLIMIKPCREWDTIMGV